MRLTNVHGRTETEIRRIKVWNEQSTEQPPQLKPALPDRIMADQAPPTRQDRHSIAFLLQHEEHDRDHAALPAHATSAPLTNTNGASHVAGAFKPPLYTSSLPRRTSVPKSRSREEKRKARQCTVEGCTNYTIDRGLCFRHGVSNGLWCCVMRRSKWTWITGGCAVR